MAFFAAFSSIVSANTGALYASATLGPPGVLASLAVVTIEAYMLSKVIKRASGDLAGKNIHVDVPLLKKPTTIPTYFWMFSNMTEEQTNIVTAWMSQLITQLGDSAIQTYKKTIIQDNRKYEFRLPETHFSATWTTKDDKKIKWHVTPQRRNGFILEGDLSWIPSDMLKRLPGPKM